MNGTNGSSSHPFLDLLRSPEFADGKLPSLPTDADDNGISSDDDLWRTRSRDLAQWLDQRDPVRQLREEFHVPKMKTLPNVDFSLMDSEEEESIYFCGNSVGLQPKCSENFIQGELKQWAEMGVHSHFSGEQPWTRCDDRLLEEVAQLVGAKSPLEVGLMNSLTINIHALFTAFFQPTATRFKVLLEAQAFPSDHYAIEAQLRLKGLDPGEAMICMSPREGEECLRTEDILALVQRSGSQIAIVFFSGVQYYTGQLFDIQRITRCAQEQGCLVGWDLAHCVANVPLRLHDWNVDFACWCNYKYVSAGPGAVGGMFIHERFAHEGPADRPGRLLGWWGHRLESRFRMDNRMELAPGVAGYRLSTPSPLLMAGIRAFLEVMAKTSMEQLRRKSLLLTGYLEFLLDRLLVQSPDKYFSLITPRDPQQRGCQLSLKFNNSCCDVGLVYNGLIRRGVVVDKRAPNVIRVAAVHFYNSFDDVWRFVQVLEATIQEATGSNETEKKNTKNIS